MITRSDFVTNSSSSSFVVKGSWYDRDITEESLREDLEKMLEIHEALTGQHKEIDDILTITPVENIEEIAKRYKEVWWGLREEELKDMEGGKFIIITDENSVPYPVLSMIDEYYNCVKKHLG